MLRDVHESIVMLAEDDEDVGWVKKTVTIAKRVACTRCVDECDFREVSVVSALRVMKEKVQSHIIN